MDKIGNFIESFRPDETRGSVIDIAEHYALEAIERSFPDTAIAAEAAPANMTVPQLPRAEFIPVSNDEPVVQLSEYRQRVNDAYVPQTAPAAEVQQPAATEQNVARPVIVVEQDARVVEIGRKAQELAQSASSLKTMVDELNDKKAA